MAVSHLPDPAADVRRGSWRSSPPRSSPFSQTPGDGLAPSPGASQSAKPPLQTLQSARSKTSPVTGAETADGNGRKWHIRSRRCCQTADRHQDRDATDGTRSHIDRGDSEATETHRREAENWAWDPDCQREQTHPEEGRADYTHQGSEEVQALWRKSHSFLWTRCCFLSIFPIKLDHVTLVKRYMHLLKDSISRSIHLIPTSVFTSLNQHFRATCWTQWEVLTCICKRQNCPTTIIHWSGLTWQTTSIALSTRVITSLITAHLH